MVSAEIGNLKIASMTRLVALYTALSEDFHLILSKGHGANQVILCCLQLSGPINCMSLELFRHRCKCQTYTTVLMCPYFQQGF